MKKIWILLIGLLAGLHLEAKENKDTNVAYQDGNVRFTVIDEGVIRLEWHADAQFVDAASFLAVNRTYDKADYRLSESKNWVEIATDKMVLKYKKNSGRFSASNLSIRSKNLTPAFQWKPGDVNQGNLKGTYRTLDGYNGEIFVGNGNDNGDHRPMPIEDGLLSTDGWTLLDDSKGLLFDNSDWAWVDQRKGSDQDQDWYFMAYGHDYKGALKDFTVLRVRYLCLHVMLSVTGGPDIGAIQTTSCATWSTSSKRIRFRWMCWL